MNPSVDEIVAKIGGNVLLSANPGLMLRSWRERLGIKQSSLAKNMSVSPSVLSDYESGRRASPGIVFVRRYIESLVKLDQEKGKLLEKLIFTADRKEILAMGEFKTPVKASAILEAISGKALTDVEGINANLYGYTVLDSINTIYTLSGLDFYRIFGATTERVLIFTKVGMGRSPLVAIRVSQLKPRMVVLHGPKVVDPLAIQLAQRDRIVLGLSTLNDEESFGNILSKF
ncbi:MAG: helix-turn-helix domain-containing protein [Thaumarchaeota archaeon]|nr:helix-turn-helix domain-containing protein [Nitrososphaerota archaeon]